jgi:signal transduction histidine kinase
LISFSPTTLCPLRYLAFVCLQLFITYSGRAQIQIRRIVIDGDTTKGTHAQIVRLAASSNDLVLDFVPINAPKDSIEYFYRLKPISDRWSPSFYPSAHYQDLSGGKYTFEIYAQTTRNRSAITQIVLEVEEAFWQEAWFWPSIMAYVLLIVGIGIYLFFLYDFRQKLKIQHVRNQIASDLHDEVGSNLNSIAIFAELLRKKAVQDPALLPLLDKITANSEETVTLMRDTVWAINPTNDSTEKLLERMRSFGAEVLAAKGIVFDFQATGHDAKIIFSMEQRRNLYLIYKEAINNIVKHAYATKVNVKCKITGSSGQFQMIIEDNGVGFDSTQVFEGNGLKNFKRRSEDDDLDVILTSQLHKGTQITILVLL